MKKREDARENDLILPTHSKHIHGKRVSPLVSKQLARGTQTGSLVFQGNKYLNNTGPGCYFHTSFIPFLGFGVFSEINFPYYKAILTGYLSQGIANSPTFKLPRPHSSGFRNFPRQHRVNVVLRGIRGWNVSLLIPPFMFSPHTHGFQFFFKLLPCKFFQMF